jgi:hypothetical protein
MSSMGEYLSDEVYLTERVSLFLFSARALRLTAMAELTRSSVKTDALWLFADQYLCETTCYQLEVPGPPADLNL